MPRLKERSIKNQQKRMNAVIYCRVSSKEQVEGTSLESQEIACREYAQRNRIEIVQVFVDKGESAKFADRPQLLEMLSFCKKRGHSVEQLLVWKVDRLARNVGDHFNIKAELVKYGVRVVSVTEPIDAKPEGRLLETILAGFAQFDNDVRAARTVQGMRRKLQEGIFPWQPPLGYKGAAPPGSKKQEPDRPDQPAFGILQEAWTKFASGGYTKAQILRVLSGRGLKTRSGRAITSQFVDHLFDDLFYAGILRDPWSGEEIPGKHLPMVSRETFDAVRRVVAGRSRSLPHFTTRPEFPLRTFVRCASCEQALTGSFSRGRSKTYPYYHCNNRNCDNHGNYALSEVHAEFAQFLSDASATPHAIAHLKHYLRRLNEITTAQVDRFRRTREAEKERARKHLKELIRMKMDRLISDEEFQQERKAIEASSAPPEIDESMLDTGSTDAVINDLDAVTGYLSNLPDAWMRVAPQFQRRFQQMMIPDGYLVGSVGTASKGRLLSFLGSPLPLDTDVVPPTWKTWNQLTEEISGLAMILRESCG
jgi:DNA invertase Pin-like site-specific DNA recombinase